MCLWCLLVQDNLTLSRSRSISACVRVHGFMRGGCVSSLRVDISACFLLPAALIKPKQVLKPRTILHIVDLLRQQEARNMEAEPSRDVTGSRPSKAIFPHRVAAPIDSASVLPRQRPEDQERNVALFMQLERKVVLLGNKQVERQEAERQREEAERRERQRTPSPSTYRTDPFFLCRRRACALISLLNSSVKNAASFSYHCLALGGHTDMFLFFHKLTGSQRNNGASKCQTAVGSISHGSLRK